MHNADKLSNGNGGLFELKQRFRVFLPLALLSVVFGFLSKLRFCGFFGVTRETLWKPLEMNEKRKR